MRFLVIMAFIAAAAVAAPSPQKNGDIVSTCDDKTQLGQQSCFGTTGFITCTHRGNIFRPCAPGTTCGSKGICIG